MLAKIIHQEKETSNTFKKLVDYITRENLKPNKDQVKRNISNNIYYCKNSLYANNFYIDILKEQLPKINITNIINTNKLKDFNTYKNINNNLQIIINNNVKLKNNINYIQNKINQINEKNIDNLKFKRGALNEFGYRGQRNNYTKISKNISTSNRNLRIIYKNNYIFSNQTKGRLYGTIERASRDVRYQFEQWNKQFNIKDRGGINDRNIELIRRNIEYSRININQCEKFRESNSWRWDRSFSEFREHCKRNIISYNERNRQVTNKPGLNYIIENINNYNKKGVKENFLCMTNCSSVKSAAFEMDLIASNNTIVKNPLEHIILTWQKNEMVSDENILNSVEYTLDKLNAKDHQFVASIHRDTEHPHVHIVLNKINQNTFLALDKKFIKLRLDKIMRELELKYNFKHSPGYYKVDYTDSEPKIIKDTRKNKQNQSKFDPIDMFSDRESFLSYVNDEPKKSILRALKNDKLNWQQLHNLLAKYGLEIKHKGQGFVIASIGQIDNSIYYIKASSVHEKLSKGRLEKLLGEYQPHENREYYLDHINNIDDYIDPSIIRDIYSDKRTKDQTSTTRDPKIRAERKRKRAADRKLLKEQYLKYKEEYYKSKNKIIYEVKNNFKRNKPTDPEFNKILNILKKENKAKVISDHEIIRKQINDELMKIKLTKRCLNMKDWAVEQAMLGNEPAIAFLRGVYYAQQRKNKKNDNKEEIKERYLYVGSINIFGYDDEIGLDNKLSFTVSNKGYILYSSNNGTPLFLDKGYQVLISKQAENNNEQLLISLKYAINKLGAIEITGTAEFKEKVIKLLAKSDIQNIKFKNKEQQDQYNKEVKNIELEKNKTINPKNA